MTISMPRTAFAAGILGCAALVAPARAENTPAADPSAAVYTVRSVNTRDAGEGFLMATGVVTPFGLSGVRPPDIVVDGPNWGNRHIKPRAALAISDLNFQTTPDLPEGGVREAAVLYNRGFRNLYPGPDLFIFERTGQSSGVRVSPIYRMPDESLREGEPVVIDFPGRAGEVPLGARTLHGVGIDLDDWAKRGVAPEGAVLTGAVIRHDTNGAPFEPEKIMVADGAVIGLLGQNVERPLLNDFGLNSGGGFESDGLFGGGGGGIAPGTTPTEVPSPGGAALLLMGVSARAALRGRRPERLLAPSCR